MRIKLLYCLFMSLSLLLSSCATKKDISPFIGTRLVNVDRTIEKGKTKSKPKPVYTEKNKEDLSRLTADMHLKLEEQLLDAAEHGQTFHIKQLIEDGVDINFQLTMKTPVPHGPNLDGWNALTFAILKAHRKTAELLLDNGINVNASIGEYGSNLNFALGRIIQKSGKSFHGKERQPMAFFKLLIEKGADLNIPSKDGLTPLMLSSISGSSELVKILLKKGALLNTKDRQGNTALIFAEKNKNHEVIQLLKTWAITK